MALRAVFDRTPAGNAILAPVDGPRVALRSFLLRAHRGPHPFLRLKYLAFLMHTGVAMRPERSTHRKTTAMVMVPSVVIAGLIGDNCRAVLVKIPGQPDNVKRSVQRIRLFFSVA